MRIFCSAGILLLIHAIVMPGSVAWSQESKNGAELVIGKDPVGQPLIDFEGVTVDGIKVASEQMRGKVLLVDLWGLNCGSCLDEMRALEPIYREFKDQGLEIWAVNSEQINSEEIRKGLKEKELSVSYTLLMDEKLEITRIFTSWFIPVTVIVDKDGTVQYYKIGFNSSEAEKIRGVVGELLK